jgi:D-arabinose 1-dehydrogenase-like Zn-dependent alcohol dehydrogenase
MFAVYATHAAPDDPLAALKVGEWPEPDVPREPQPPRSFHAARAERPSRGIMGTLKDMEDMARLISRGGIEPEIGVVLPMERAEEGFRAMWEGRTRGKTVFIR